MHPQDPLDCLKGIGPRLAANLDEAGVHSVADLLLHLPKRYEDRSRVHSLAELTMPCKGVLLRVEVARIRVARQRRGGRRIVSALLRDANADFEAVWFNQRWVDRRLHEGAELFVYGDVQELPGGALKLVNPEIEGVEQERAQGVVPVYAPLGPLSSRRVRTLMPQALGCLDGQVEEGVDGLPSLAEALRHLHGPQLDEGSSARQLAALNAGTSPQHLRLVFEEAVAFFCVVERQRADRLARRAPRCRVTTRQREMARAMLPFALTTAQKRVMREIARDLQRDRPMARLLQGDVGSGKTVIAALALLIAVSSGVQGVLMAPTELLAEQHHASLAPLFRRAGLELALLTGSMPAAEQHAIREGLAAGRTTLVVGTHALFQEQVAFAELGLVVVDEQHRFGVRQRQMLVEKGRAPHLLVMTATPIPRTLSLTAYADLELSVIDELPPGRKEVRTELRFAEARPRVLDFLARELAAGGRAFVVSPLIEASATLELQSLDVLVPELEAAFPGVGIGVLHGRLGREERERVTEAFRRGELQVLAATTVVEVGVDVPEATVMLIDSAQRFGLSQLHQLRGRVGRGERPAWCILMADTDAGEAALARLRAFARTNDGFAIAEADLEQRGPGELTGDRQWGAQHFRFVDLLRHHSTLQAARERVRTARREGRLQELEQAVGLFQSFPERFPVG